MAKIKNNIKKIIEEKGLKQKYIAEKAGISEQTLSNCINDRFDVSLKVALLIAKALDKSIDEVFDIDD